MSCPRGFGEMRRRPFLEVAIVTTQSCAKPTVVVSGIGQGAVSLGGRGNWLEGIFLFKVIMD